MKPQRPVVPSVWEGIYLYLKLEIQRERDWIERLVINLLNCCNSKQPRNRDFILRQSH